MERRRPHGRAKSLPRRSSSRSETPVTPREVVIAVETAFQKAVYGEKGEQKATASRCCWGHPKSGTSRTKPGELSRCRQARLSGAPGNGSKSSRQNMKAMREQNALPGGLVAALFGRMVTADVEANIDAAIHVAHAFTVHAEESESDYFTVVDDLRRIEDDSGADHIGETELTCGLFYGYVVVDRDVLLDNLSADGDMAGEVCRRLVHLIATVSPGAKLGSTAPYGYASWMMLEAGDAQPRSLGEAFRSPCGSSTEAAEKAVAELLQKLDHTYETGEARRTMSLNGAKMPGARPVSLPKLAEWAREVVRRGHA